VHGWLIQPGFFALKGKRRWSLLNVCFGEKEPVLFFSRSVDQWMGGRGCAVYATGLLLVTFNALNKDGKIRINVRVLSSLLQ
jgi:hypothetical protein